ncbi:CD63 antigen-like [Clinocottus analis]|uniref:CD63 antigen-like n=1 Tax=Clinocottus analis TaxID=304258 RepID=UPI0035BFB714
MEDTGSVSQASQTLTVKARIIVPQPEASVLFQPVGPVPTMCMFHSAKCCFLFFTAIFSASGIALIIIGALQYSNYSVLGAFAMASVSKISIVFIAVGVAITLISLLGELGAFFENKSMVSCFISILVIIILLQIITGTVFYLFGNQFRCCGANGAIDWTTSEGWTNHDAVPDSCCVVKSPDCGQNKENVHGEGCLKAIDTFMTNNLRWVSAVCICLGIAGVLGVISGVCFVLTMAQKSYENMS